MADLLSTENLLIVGAIALVIPGLVTLLTKVDAPDGVKNLVHALLAALAGVGFDFTQALLSSDREFSLRSAAVLAMATWAASTFTYIKAWKNSSTNSALGARTQGFGFGTQEAVVPAVPPAELILK